MAIGKFVEGKRYLSDVYLPSTHPSRRMAAGLGLLAVSCTLAGLALGGPFGRIGAYAPLLLAVCGSSWLGGLWPAVLTQFGTAGLIFCVRAQPFSRAVSHSEITGLLLFELIAHLSMFLLLSWRSMAQLSRTAEQMEVAAGATHDVIWKWELATGQVMRSGKVGELFGCSAADIVPEMVWWRARIDVEDEGRVWESLQRALDTEETHWESEYRIRRDNGSTVSVSDHALIVRDLKGRPLRLLGGMSDITAERHAEERLVHNAFHDSLTGMPNRELFLDRLERALDTRSAGSADVVSVIYLNVDRFKVINDSLGHRIGDQLLIALGVRIARYLRQCDIAARFTADEFIILLDGIERAGDATHVAERIQHCLLVPFELDNQEVGVSVSMGIAFGDGPGTAEELLRRAGVAMYEAKQQGRARFHVFEPALDRVARNHFQLTSELRQSFYDDSLRLYYQPIISLATGELASFEALLRWQHPQRGIVFPSEILPAAEEAGLSTRIGQWVLREACRQIRSWQDRQLTPAAFAVSINLSGLELMRPALIQEIKQLLAETGLRGEALVIEVTETTIMETNLDAARRLGKLRELGIRLALDDFGKGHSSLGRLQDFPISILKVDSSFVRQIAEGRRQVLDAIMALGHGLDLELVVEGVETREQLRYLRERGAAKAQGLLFSGALPAEAATELLAGRQRWDVTALLGTSAELSTGRGAG